LLQAFHSWMLLPAEGLQEEIQSGKKLLPLEDSVTQV
jgi:hypothetical protein